MNESNEGVTHTNHSSTLVLCLFLFVFPLSLSAGYFASAIRPRTRIPNLQPLDLSQESNSPKLIVSRPSLLPV